MASSESTPLLRTPADNGSAPVSTYESFPDGAGSSRSPEQTSQTGREPEPEAQGTFARQFSAATGFKLLVGIVIGSGVFTSPGPIDANVPSPAVALLVWLVGGLLAWTGALTMAELGTAIPGEGGVQPYLARIYGEHFGFLAAWSWIVAVMPATLAILSIVFVETIYSALGLNAAASSIAHKLFSLLILAIITAGNSLGTKMSNKLGDFFVWVKFLSIGLLGTAGLVVVFTFAGNHDKDFGGGDWHSKNWFKSRDTLLPDGSALAWTSVPTWELLGHLSAALYGALWAYSGWDKANYVAAEFRNPSKQLPLAINTAIPTVIFCYIAANAVYYVLLPWNVVSVTDSAAVTAIHSLLGSAGASIAALLICLVVAGSLQGNSFVAGRMIVAAANQSWLPRSLCVIGRVGRAPHVMDEASEGEVVSGAPSELIVIPVDTPKNQSDAPINALLLTALISAVYILFGNMRVLLTFNGLGEYTFFFLTVLGDIILRRREPDLVRPFKPNIIIPILFTLVSGFVVVRGAIFAPIQAAILLGIWAAGMAYFSIRRHSYLSEY